MNGIQEVSGSIPLISTKKHRNRLISVLFLYYFPFVFRKSYLLRTYYLQDKSRRAPERSRRAALLLFALYFTPNISSA